MTSTAYHENDKVEIIADGQWHPATVLAAAAAGWTVVRVFDYMKTGRPPEVSTVTADAIRPR